MQPPEILDGYGGWCETFWELHTERQIGMGVGPIPQSAIDHHIAGWAYDEADMFIASIRAMDDVYLRVANKQEGQETASPVSAKDAFRSAFSGRKGRNRGQL